MKNLDTVKSIEQLEEELVTKTRELAELKRKQPPTVVRDYAFKTWDGGEVKLSELFKGREDLILVHNMGRRCRWCTLWADGFVSVLPHLQDRAAFVLTSPDEPAIQKEFATGRGWNFPMVSADKGFIGDMGMLDDEGGYNPGVSTFHRGKDGKIVRVAKSSFGPGDPFCSVWHFFDLLKDGDNDWEPQYKY